MDIEKQPRSFSGVLGHSVGSTEYPLQARKYSWTHRTKRSTCRRITSLQNSLVVKDSSVLGINRQNWQPNSQSSVTVQSYLYQTTDIVANIQLEMKDSEKATPKNLISATHPPSLPPLP
jgi:hypothetical protein